MILLDQANEARENHVVDMVSTFQRPRSDMIIGPGSSQFMPLDRLNNRQYIQDDVIFIKIIVEDQSDESVEAV